MQKRLINYCEISAEGFLNGITVPIFKPADWTSFDVVNKCRYITQMKKVGHAGTLDPFAEGVLVLGFGRHTKKLNLNRDKQKEYLVDIRLGAETDTQDSTGQIMKRTNVDSLPAIGDIQTVLEKFHGKINQIPPMYSAKKVNGKKLYTLARQGKIIERAPVEIQIYDIELCLYEWPLCRCRIVCGPGTYIRTLAHDIGQVLTCGGYAQKLVRSRSGDFGLNDCFKIDEFEQEWTYLKESGKLKAGRR